MDYNSLDIESLRAHDPPSGLAAAISRKGLTQAPRAKKAARPATIGQVSFPLIAAARSYVGRFEICLIWNPLISLLSDAWFRSPAIMFMFWSGLLNWLLSLRRLSQGGFVCNQQYPLVLGNIRADSHVGDS